MQARERTAVLVSCDSRLHGRATRIGRNNPGGPFGPVTAVLLVRIQSKTIAAAGIQRVGRVIATPADGRLLRFKTGGYLSTVGVVCCGVHGFPPGFRMGAICQSLQPTATRCTSKARAHRTKACPSSGCHSSAVYRRRLWSAWGRDGKLVVAEVDRRQALDSASAIAHAARSGRRCARERVLP